MISKFLALSMGAVIALFCAADQPAIAPGSAPAALVGVKPVETGVVIRGLTINGRVGTKGTPTYTTCSFVDEPVGQRGRMKGASVNCRPDGNLHDTLPGLPARFNAYCVIDAPVKSGRLIQAEVPDNANHCDLSGITPKDAEGQFGGAVWR